MKFDFENLTTILGKPAHGAEARSVIDCEPSKIERFDHISFLEFKESGISAIFKEAPWIIPEGGIVDVKELYLCAFHLHRHGHENYMAYMGKFPHGVTFGDTANEVILKLGEPITTGGGGTNSVLKDKNPSWLRYSIGKATLQFQLDDQGKVEMATVSAERQTPGLTTITE